MVEGHLHVHLGVLVLDVGLEDDELARIGLEHDVCPEVDRHGQGDAGVVVGVVADQVHPSRAVRVPSAATPGASGGLFLRRHAALTPGVHRRSDRSGPARSEACHEPGSR